MNEWKFMWILNIIDQFNDTLAFLNIVNQQINELKIAINDF